MDATKDDDALPGAGDAPSTPSTDAAATSTDATATGTASGDDKPAITAQLSNAASAAAASMSSVFSLVNMNLAKARQLASETIGRAEKTEMSEEYRKLETQFDRIRAVVENLAKVGTLFIQPGIFTDVKMQMASSIEIAASTIQGQSNVEKPIVDRLRSVDLPKASSSQSLGMHFVRNGQMLGEEMPLGLALLKCGDAQDKVGRAKLQMNVDIHEKFVKPLESLQDIGIRNAMNARRTVQNARLNLDAIKLRLKSTRPEKLEQVRAEIDMAQQQLDAAIVHATDLMKAVVNSNDVLSSLADFTQAMLVYYRTGNSLLEELAPEIDAMKVAQEASASAGSS